MGLYLRFLNTRSRTKPISAPFSHIGLNNIWKRTYIPPWPMLYHIIEILLLVFFFLNVISPVVYDYFLHRKVFVDAFYPEIEEDSPISDFNTIDEIFIRLSDAMHALLTDSFMEVHLSPRKFPVLCIIQWRNGTVSETEYPNITLDFFHHISKITPSVDFYTISREKSIPGCSRWVLSIEIYSQEGLSQFTVTPSIYRTYCNKSFFSNIVGEKEFRVYTSPEVLAHQKELKKRLDNSNFFRSFSKSKKKKNINSRRHFSKKETIAHSISPILGNSTYDYHSIPLYRVTLHISLLVIVISFIHLICMFSRIKARFQNHCVWKKINTEYNNLSALDQFHFSIGYWFVIDVFSSILVFFFSVYTMYSTQTITQFPSQLSVELMSLGLMLSFIRFNQWFGVHAPFYQLIVILRQSMIYLFNLVIGIIPLVVGSVLFGVFSFGLVSDAFRSVLKLVQRFITIGMGDSIDDFYIVIDDGTEFTAWLSFFYVSILTAGGMWIIFTSCIATVMYVHETYIVEHDSFWESSTESVSEET